jgi:hypothetical protein
MASNPTTNDKSETSNIRSDLERAAVQLALGQKKPENEWERKLLKEMEAMEKAGKGIEIPQDW